MRWLNGLHSAVQVVAAHGEVVTAAGQKRRDSRAGASMTTSKTWLF